MISTNFADKDRSQIEISIIVLLLKSKHHIRKHKVSVIGKIDDAIPLSSLIVSQLEYII